MERKTKRELKIENEGNRNRFILGQSSALVRQKQFQPTPAFPSSLHPWFHGWKPFKSNFNQHQ
jgi:hypothetical protein